MIIEVSLGVTPPSVELFSVFTENVTSAPLKASPVNELISFFELYAAVALEGCQTIFVEHKKIISHI